MKFVSNRFGRIDRTRKVILVPALALILGGCGMHEKAAPAAPQQMPPTNVSAIQVIAKDVPVYIDEIGKCAAPEIVSIQPQVSGKIVEIHFKEGQDVKKGEKLFTIDSKPYEATLAQMVADNELNKAALDQSEAALGQYKAQLEEAKAVLAQSKTRQELNELELERAKGLVASKAVAQQELDSRTMMVKAGRDQIAADTAAIARAEAQIRQGASTVNMSRAKIGSTEAMITSAKINLGYTVIYSPIDGRTGQRMTDVGNVVNSGMNMSSNSPLVVVQRMDPLYVDFTVPEMDLARTKASLAAGILKAQCRAPEAGGVQREGDVVFLDSSVQDGSGTVKLRASIPNADRAFWPGQFVKIKLILATKKDTPMVPTTAPQVGQTGPFVFVVKADSTVELRPIKLGQKHGDMIAIEDGLKVGEQVVTAGQMMLYPEAKVNVEKPAENSEMKGPAKAAEKAADKPAAEKTGGGK